MSVDFQQKCKDERFGREGEDEVLKILQNKYGNVKKYMSKYCEMDYYITNEKGDVIHEFEVKTRRVNHDKYPSLVFGFNKYERSVNALECGIKSTFLWNCRDGLFFWDLHDPIQQSDEFYFGTIRNIKRNDPEDSKAVHVYSQYLLPLT